VFGINNCLINVITISTKIYQTEREKKKQIYEGVISLPLWSVNPWKFVCQHIHSVMRPCQSPFSLARRFEIENISSQAYPTPSLNVDNMKNGRQK
jgi:hypothetical protein